MATGYGLGASATKAGLFLVPGAIGIALTAPLAARLSVRVGPKTTFLWGASATTFGLAMVAVRHVHEWELVTWLAIYYMGVGFVFGAAPTLILGMAPPDRRAEATGVNAVLLRIGATLGTQVAATLVTGSIGMSSLPREAGYARAFLFQAAATGAALVVACAIPGRARRAEPVPEPVAP